MAKYSEKGGALIISELFTSKGQKQEVIVFEEEAELIKGEAPERVTVFVGIGHILEADPENKRPSPINDSVVLVFKTGDMIRFKATKGAVCILIYGEPK